MTRAHCLTSLYNLFALGLPARYLYPLEPHGLFSLIRILSIFSSSAFISVCSSIRSLLTRVKTKIRVGAAIISCTVVKSPYRDEMATPQSRIGRTKQLLASSKQIPHLWMTILENIVPGFSAILSFYRDALGIDVTSLLSAAVVVFGIFRYGSTIYDGILGWASHYCTRSIIIPSEEGVYDNVLTWMTKHKLSRTSTSLRLNEWTAQMNEDHKRLTKSGADSHVKFDEWDAYVWYVDLRDHVPCLNW